MEFAFKLLFRNSLEQMRDFWYSNLTFGISHLPEITTSNLTSSQLKGLLTQREQQQYIVSHSEVLRCL